MAQNNLISRERAGRIAIQAVGGGSVVDIDLGRWNNNFVYKVEIRRNSLKFVVYINANTGRILQIKQEYETDTFDTFDT